MNCSWLIFIVSLPTRNSAGRMRVWRALKALGCGVLRDGVYLLPQRPEFRPTLQLQVEDVIAGGGSAHILALDSENQDQQTVFENLFDRSPDYAKLFAQPMNLFLKFGHVFLLEIQVNGLPDGLDQFCVIGRSVK